jgi:periplasmic copper chaperone A
VRRWLPAVVLAAALTVATAGCGAAGSPDLAVGPARAAPPAAGASQVVLTIENRGDGDDTLVGSDTDAALDTEIHLTEVADGRAAMGVLDEVVVPAGGSVEFRPGALHLMLVVPDGSVVVGGTFDLTLRFDRSDPITVPVEVVELPDLLEDAADE